jgi:hypothetical protein
MATDINIALAEFMRDTVNLERDQTKWARESRDWLLGRISNFAVEDDKFPNPYKEKDILLGSFHRRTKTRPLDDIDLITALTAEGSTYATYPDRICLNVHSESKRLLGLCHEGTVQLNSKRVLNKLVDSLKNVAQYRRADIGRNGEAAVVSLVTYDWSFDVVPAFFTVPEADGRTYYLIPDGAGHWKKTDPRIDEQRIAKVSQTHGDIVLSCIRLLKYWNKRRTVPTVRSYVLESMIISYYERPTTKSSQFVDIELRTALDSLAISILSPVPDPKGLQGDLNSLSLQERLDLSARARSDVALLAEARTAETSGDHRTAMARWRQVIGDTFPAYG